ncbi:MAG: RDD family protein [Candidatus Binatia bacterium]
MKTIEEIRWGGLWRRLSAFSIDLLVLNLLSSLLFYLSYVGYSVGLAAHGRGLSASNLPEFLRILFFAWLCLVGGYFVLFHGMEGRTIGKGLLGLRVVGPNRSRITYRQALIRWIAFFPAAVSGLGLLWILWDREKRGWHDRLAQTWVIRE